MTEYGGNAREDEYARTLFAIMTSAKNVFLEPRAAALVATTTFGLGSSPCPRSWIGIPMVSDGSQTEQRVVVLYYVGD